MSFKKTIAIVLVIISVAGGILLYRTFTKSTTKVLETARVTKGSIRGVIVETGIIKPQVGAVVKIGARATGTIMKLNVKIGDRVGKGQLIALIDDREIRKAIEQQKASLSSAENTLIHIELTYPERIREAAASHEYARITYDRETALLKQEFRTKDALDRARSQFDASEANLKRLRSEYVTQMNIANPKITQAKHTRLIAIPGRPPNLIDPPPGCKFAPRCAYAQDLCRTEEPVLRSIDNPDHTFACHFPVGTPEGDAAFEANVAAEYPRALAAIGKVRATEDVSV